MNAMAGSAMPIERAIQSLIGNLVTAIFFVVLRGISCVGTGRATVVERI